LRGELIFRQHTNNYGCNSASMLGFD
jgi:hypothetical protein